MSAGDTRTPIARWTERAGLLILLVLAARFLTMYFHRGANLLDEGSTVAAANRILHGDVIYRDFLAAATPGSFYTVAWLFQIFGAELIVVRWLVVALCLGTMAVTFVIARHLMSWPFAAASALMTIAWGWFLLAPNLYSLEAMFLALVALACYLQGWTFYAGLACGYTGLSPTMIRSSSAPSTVSRSSSCCASLLRMCRLASSVVLAIA